MLSLSTLVTNKSANGHGHKTPRNSISLLQALLLCAPILALIAGGQPLSAAASTSINVNPVTGDDSLCGIFFASGTSCKTIARAVQLNKASLLNLSAGVYNETTISISNVASLVILGVPDATVFDCRRRWGAAPGAAFSIINSTVIITGVTFQSCSNPTSNGGAVNANGSSVVLSQCSFKDCSAANGGAVSATGPGSGLFISVQNSTFSNNFASGNLADCPANPSLPCSTWGGAIATFEMFNVSISGCTMVNNKAVAIAATPVNSASSVAGGGCVSVLFHGNASGSTVHIRGSTFVLCNVDVPDTNILRGNGEFQLLMHCNANACATSLLTEAQDTAVRSRSTLAFLLDCSCWMCPFSNS
jgi:hypothetical protein